VAAQNGDDVLPKARDLGAQRRAVLRRERDAQRVAGARRRGCSVVVAEGSLLDIASAVESTS